MFKAYKRLSPEVSDVQIALSDTHINHLILNLVEELKSLRAAYDCVWLDKNLPTLSSNEISFLTDKIRLTKKKVDSSFSKNYPIGFCFHITSTLVEFVEKFKFCDEKSDFFKLNDFKSNGGIFKKIWGIYNETSFQTAIQLGKWYIDVAADTFDKQEGKVEFSLLEESKFSIITSIEEYCRILKKQENKEVYFNNLFPELWPYFPFFIKSENKIKIPESKYFSGLCTHNKLEALKHELSKNDISTLSEEELRAMKTKIEALGGNYVNKKYLVNRIMNKGEFFALLKMRDEERGDILKAVNYINFIINHGSNH